MARRIEDLTATVEITPRSVTIDGRDVEGESGVLYSGPAVVDRIPLDGIARLRRRLAQS